MSFTPVAVGQRPVPDPKEEFSRRTLPSAIWNAASGDSGSEEFESGGSDGKIQQLTVNRNEVMELVRSSSERVKRSAVTAALNRGDGPVMNSPLTFESPAAYVVTKFKIYATFEIYFQLKTTQANGLVLYSGQSGKDFLAVELVGGHVRYSYDVGSSPRTIRVNLRHPVNDNRWHDVTIFRQTLTEQVLRVDNASKVDRLTDSHSVHFDIAGEEFYIGGVPRSLYGSLVKQVKSRDGFQGCLASIDLNKGGDSRSILEQGTEIPLEYQDQIKEGCEGPVSECTAESCDNGGFCIQGWNSFTCDCDMTSFTGPTCSEDGIAYTFGSEGALMTFSYGERERTDTRQDALSFGFRTTRRDGVVLQITSAKSNDYIELVLVDGNLFAVYNMGTIDHPIGELTEKVDDGNYHVVRFHRNGANSTLQVDDLPVLSKHPSGRQRCSPSNPCIDSEILKLN